jgi:predicted amidophosphoribosyltransferase
MIFEIIYYIWGFDQLGKRRKRRKTIVICTQCESEWPKESKFCGKCGGRHLVSVPEFEKIEDQKYKEKQNAALEAIKRNEIRDRILVLRNATQCPSCNIYFDPPTQFCSLCGQDVTTFRIPDESLHQIIQSEYPKSQLGFHEFLELANGKKEELKGVGFAESMKDLYKWWRR